MKKNTKLTACIKITLGIVAIILSLLALLYVHENYSGAKAWAKVKSELEAAEVSFSLKELQPALPPPAENFASIPMIAALTDFAQPQFDSIHSNEDFEIEYRDSANRERFISMKLPRSLSGMATPSWQTGRLPDLEAAISAIEESGEFSVPDAGSAAEKCLAVISTFKKEISELDAASERPYSVLDITLGDHFIEQINMVLPFLHELLNHLKFQSVRCTAALETGDTEQAVAALKVMNQLCEAAGSTPLLIGLLVDISGRGIMISNIWHGLETGKWSGPDLDEIIALLPDSEQILTNTEKALNFEMVAMQIGGSDFLKEANSGQTSRIVRAINGDSLPTLGRAIPLIPSGIWDHNKAIGCRLMLENGILPIRNRDFSQASTFEKVLGKKTPRNFFAAITCPAIQGVITKSVAVAAYGDFASLACALEKYQKTHGSYPNSLDQLVPDLLPSVPLDPVTGKDPLKYSIDSSTMGYQIYSIGMNGVDDGGTIVWRNNVKKKRVLEEGDWVWNFPAQSSP